MFTKSRGGECRSPKGFYPQPPSKRVPRQLRIASKAAEEGIEPPPQFGVLLSKQFSKPTASSAIIHKPNYQRSSQDFLPCRRFQRFQYFLKNDVYRSPQNCPSPLYSHRIPFLRIPFLCFLAALCMMIQIKKPADLGVSGLISPSCAPVSYRTPPGLSYER